MEFLYFICNVLLIFIITIKLYYYINYKFDLAIRNTQEQLIDITNNIYSLDEHNKEIYHKINYLTKKINNI
jgi:peptidoglycan hydrolase CwlO-like protein